MRNRLGFGCKTPVCRLKWNNCFALSRRFRVLTRLLLLLLLKCLIHLRQRLLVLECSLLPLCRLCQLMLKKRNPRSEAILRYTRASDIAGHSCTTLRLSKLPLQSLNLALLIRQSLPHICQFSLPDATQIFASSIGWNKVLQHLRMAQQECTDIIGVGISLGWGSVSWSGKLEAAPRRREEEKEGEGFCEAREESACQSGHPSSLLT